MFSSEKTKAFYGRNSSSGGSGNSNGGNVDGGTSKSSYYVWFLGSREAKGLRGAEYIRPAVRHLLEYKTDLCRKMTLQVRFVLNDLWLRESRTPAFYRNGHNHTTFSLHFKPCCQVKIFYKIPN